MKLPANAIIASQKLTGYLLRKLPENDKSGYLAEVGYTPKNPERLETDLRNQILTCEAEFMETTEYGDKYSIHGELTGPNGRMLKVITIWMTEDATGLTKFITHYPSKET